MLFRSYRFEWERFRVHSLPHELRTLRLRDLHGYLNSLSGLSPRSQARAQAALKSLFSFGVRIGYLPMNLGAFLRPLSPKDSLSERILDEAALHSLIARETKARNRIMLRLLYAAGLRVSELCALKRRDLTSRGETGQVTVYGKGRKTRVVLLSPATWREIVTLLGADPAPESPVFASQKGGGHLHPSQEIGRAHV